MSWLAEKMHLDLTTISHLCKGHRHPPTLENAILIERFTEGAVPAISWLDPERLVVRMRGHKIPGPKAKANAT